MISSKYILSFVFILLETSFLLGQEITIDRISFDKSGQIKWEVLNEKVNTKFDIEEFRWNNWVSLGQVSGKGTGNNSYSFLADTTCGVYTVRIKTNAYTSKTVNYPNPAKINVTGGCTKSFVRFGHKTKFEVWDQYGKKILSGCDSIINIKDLKKGNYFLNCGDKLTEFNKY